MDSVCGYGGLLETFGNFLRYDPSTGEIIRKVNRGRWKAGTKVGSLRKDGYLSSTFSDGKDILLHRLAWYLYYGVWPKQEIDHINGIKDDNRIVNLREVTRAQNNQNIRQAKGKTKTGYLGVRPYKEGFRAFIRSNGKVKYLGFRNTAIEAYQLYLDAKRLLHEGNTL